MDRDDKPSVSSFTVIGAGVGGLVLAILLSRRGHEVQVYDKRTVFDKEVDGRSISFTISGRGLRIFEQLGLKEKVLAHCMVLHGRMVHLQKARPVLYKYGTQKAHVLYSIRRSKLIDILLREVALESKIILNYGFELLNIDKTNMVCQFLDTASQAVVFRHASCVIGADGVFSTVRHTLLKGQMTSYHQRIFDWAYKEFYFERQDAERLGLTADHLHVWPKPKALLVGIPNNDKSFSVIFTAPVNDADGKENDFDALVAKEYPDLLRLMPSFFSKAVAVSHHYFVSIKLGTWHYEDKIVLLGDACHATFPFYGQGMISALEDVVLLESYLHDPNLSRQQAFAAYELNRKDNTNALHELSEGHLYQMTKSMVSSFWQAKDTINYKLAKWLPGKWIYEYEMMAHSNMTYRSIFALLKQQKQRSRWTGIFLMTYLLGFWVQLKKIVQR